MFWEQAREREIEKQNKKKEQHYWLCVLILQSISSYSFFLFFDRFSTISCHVVVVVAVIVGVSCLVRPIIWYITHHVLMCGREASMLRLNIYVYYTLYSERASDVPMLLLMLVDTILYFTCTDSVFPHPI